MWIIHVQCMYIVIIKYKLSDFIILFSSSTVNSNIFVKEIPQNTYIHKTNNRPVKQCVTKINVMTSHSNLG